MGEGVETTPAILLPSHRQPLPPPLSVHPHSHLLIELRSLGLQLLQSFAALVAALLFGVHLRLQPLNLFLQLRAQQLTGLAQWPHGGVELSQRADRRIHDDAGCRQLPITAAMATNQTELRDQQPEWRQLLTSESQAEQRSVGLAAAPFAWPV